MKGKYEVRLIFYMDVLKPFSRDESELQQELTIVKTFSDNIRTEMSLDNYATAELSMAR
jgi:hypothetical protein